jgi:hypothetical protein
MKKVINEIVNTAIMTFLLSLFGVVDLFCLAMLGASNIVFIVLLLLSNAPILWVVYYVCIKKYKFKKIPSISFSVVSAMLVPMILMLYLSPYRNGSDGIVPTFLALFCIVYTTLSLLQDKWKE